MRLCDDRIVLLLLQAAVFPNSFDTYEVISIDFVVQLLHLYAALLYCVSLPGAVSLLVQANQQFLF
jgi:hypothetical protein